MGVWDPSTPAGTDPKSQGDDRIREAKSAIQEALRGGAAEGNEAVFPGASPLTAPIFRYRGLKGTTAARPAVGQGGLYWNTTTKTLQRDNGTAWEDIYPSPETMALHAAAASALASVAGVVTLPETGNSFNVSGAEAVTLIAGWSAGIVIVKWVSARTLTHSATLFLKGALSRQVAANEISIFEFTGANSVREISSYVATTFPTRQTFLSGSGTYTTPINCQQLRVRMVGGGGGGAAGTTNNGASGTATLFGATSAAPGSGGIVAGAGGAGGGTASASATVLRLPGTTGGGSNGTGSDRHGASGGGSAFFGGGAPGVGGGPTLAGTANSGGGGGTSDPGGGAVCGAGGGGESVEVLINAPGATYTYTVGAGGAGGAAGAVAGGNGGSGIIIVDELY